MQLTRVLGIGAATTAVLASAALAGPKFGAKDDKEKDKQKQLSKDNKPASSSNDETAATGGPKVGDTPPKLGLEKLLQANGGTKVDWPDLKGKPVVLEFWATWCGPCVAAFPHLNELSGKYKDKVVFIAVTDEPQGKVEQFLKRRPLNTWIGLDTNGSMFKDYQANPIPKTILVGTDGKIAAVTTPTEVTEATLDDLIAAKPEPRLGKQPGTPTADAPKTPDATKPGKPANEKEEGKGATNAKPEDKKDGAKKPDGKR